MSKAGATDIVLIPNNQLSGWFNFVVGNLKTDILKDIKTF